MSLATSIYDVDSNAVVRNLTDFFPVALGNLTKINWGHAINSQAQLESAFNSDIMMIEADIVIGKLVTNEGTINNIPVMAHPPKTESDISLDGFIQKVKDFNEHATENQIKKGIKLDFKSVKALEAAMKTLEENYETMNFPVWINGDLVRGPLGLLGEIMDAKKFLPLCKKFPNVTISIGWKTNHINLIKPKYTKKHIQDMYKLIQKFQVDQPITIPVRAASGADSFEQFQNLLQVLPNETTLTIWTGSTDRIDKQKLKSFINKFGVHRVLIDLPKHIVDDLHLDT